MLTLTAVESSGEDFQSLKKSDERQDEAFAKEARAQLAYEQATSETKDEKSKSKPITSGVRRTLRYLYAIGGFAAIFRGFRLMVLWSIGRCLLGFLVSYAFRAIGLKPNSNLDRAVSDLLSTLLLSPLSLAWCHRAITRDFDAGPTVSWRRPATFGRLFQPSTWARLIRRPSLPRMPSRSALKAQLLPCAMAGGIQFLYHVLPSSFLSPLLGRYTHPRSMQKIQSGSNRQTQGNFLVAAITLVLYIEYTILRFCAWIMHEAAAISLTRVQASLLPEDQQPVVPTDRRLGVGVAAGKQASREDKWLMLLDAWRGTTWNMLWRYTKTVLKHLLLESLAVGPVMAFVALSETFVPDYRMELRQWPLRGIQAE